MLLYCHWTLVRRNRKQLVDIGKNNAYHQSYDSYHNLDAHLCCLRILLRSFRPQQRQAQPIGSRQNKGRDKRNQGRRFWSEPPQSWTHKWRWLRRRWYAFRLIIYSSFVCDMSVSCSCWLGLNSVSNRLLLISSTPSRLPILCVACSSGCFRLLEVFVGKTTYFLHFGFRISFGICLYRGGLISFRKVAHLLTVEVCDPSAKSTFSD